MSVKTLFVTLTYSDDCLPRNGSVSVRELQLYLKRLRRACGLKLRFYGVGEYGDLSWRPHYHLLVFGDFHGNHVTVQAQRRGKRCDCVFCSSWRKGFVDVQVPGTEAIAYVASYTVKKMTSKDDERLGGRAPEFCRMSLRPGIGKKGLVDIEKFVVSAEGAKYVARELDVPRVLRMSGQQWPIGRYLGQCLLEQVGHMARVRSNVRGRADVDANTLRLRLRQLELMEPGGRDSRERAREQAARRADAKWKIQQSVKGGRLETL